MSFPTGALRPRRQGSQPPRFAVGPEALQAGECRKNGERWSAHCRAPKQSEVTSQHRPGVPGLVREERDEPLPSPAAQGPQQRSWGPTERPETRGYDDGRH